MRTDWLTVALVEEIHRAVLLGKAVADVVDRLKGATLPGLLEYGCLRWARRDGSVPPLPEAVAASDLGRALGAVRSDLGLRANGPQKHPFRRLDPQTVEFHAVCAEGDIAGDEWSHFAGRFDASARGVGFSFDAAAKLQLALITCCKFMAAGQGVEKCGLACPYNPRFSELLQDIGGLDVEHLPPLVQTDVPLPRYVPLIHHPFRRIEPLDWPAVALDTYQVFKLKGEHFLAVAEDAAGLRRAFGLAPTSAVMLRGVGSDRCLERYWQYRRQDAAAEQMARLGLSLVVGPNFSHFLDVPGTERMSNRKRQLLCLDEMMRAGLSPVPHLNAVQPGDWRFWRDFLKGSPAIRFVAVEFETGNKNAVEGRKVIDHLAGIQDALGRRLHPVVVGGTQFVEQLAGRFEEASFIDSTPFVKAVHRQVFDPSAGRYPWRASWTMEGEAVDAILHHNLVHYATWIKGRWVAGSSPVPGPDRVSKGRVALPMCGTWGTSTWREQ